MADIAASDVVYTLINREIDGGKGRRENIVDVVFGDGALTYPAGGIPLLKANLGQPNDLEELFFIDPSSGDGFIYKYDESAEKVRIYKEADLTAALTELTSGVDTPAATTLRVKAIGF